MTELEKLIAEQKKDDTNYIKPEKDINGKSVLAMGSLDWMSDEEIKMRF